MRLALAGGAVALVMGLLYGLYTLSYNAGKQWQIENDRKSYSEILKRINDEDLDTTDSNAVRLELCSLAGYEPSDPECSGL